MPRTEYPLSGPEALPSNAGGVRALSHAEAPARGRPRLPGRVKLRDLSLFARQFSTLIDAGVPLVRCLAVLREQTESRRLEAVLSDVQAEVEAGTSLSRALQRHSATFPPLAIGLIRAGEVGGVLDETLSRLAAFLEKDAELRRKVKAAMTYPALVVCTAAGIVFFLVTFILPKFAAMFREMGMQKLPAVTQALIDASRFVTGGFPLRHLVIGAVAMALVAAWRAALRTHLGRRIFDRVRLRVPVFGKLSHKIAIARFARTFGTLLVSGVPILQAMETVAGTVDNAVMSDAIMKARASVREGEPIAGPLRQSRLFPAMVTHMIGIGEESGALDAMLAKIADFYEAEVDASLQSLTAALEPLMIVFLGFVVGSIVLAIFMPLTQMVNIFTGGDAGEGK